jgi:hypothetical protein
MNPQARTSIILLALVISGCAPAAQAPAWEPVEINGSGKLVSQSKIVAPFERIDAGLIFDVAIRPGDGYRVEFIADDNWVDFLAARVEGTTLQLTLKDGYSYNFSNVTMRAVVTLPEISGLNLSGSSRARISGFESLETFEAELTGASRLTGSLTSDTTRLAVFGNGSVTLSGASRFLDLEGCGNSLSDLQTFITGNAVVELSCSSTAIVHVLDQLGVEASQNSRVYYRGQPSLSPIDLAEHASLAPFEG